MTTDRAVLTFDFEFFTHTPAYRSARGEVNNPTIGLEAADFLLNLSDEVGAKGTYFFVASIAEDHPELVERFSTAGHEIGSHTYSHRLLSDLTAGQREKELIDSRQLLQRVANQEIAGFRAPAFEIVRDHFTMLNRSGYTYDSSLAPTRKIPGWYGGEYNIKRPTEASTFVSGAPDSIVEIPIGVMPGLRLPITGAWVRFFGRRYLKYGIRSLIKRGITPVMYFHPWEMVNLPRVPGIPNRVYWRTGQWMRSTLKRILNLPIDFVPASDLLSGDG